MKFAREGKPFMWIATVIALAVTGGALMRRSTPLEFAAGVCILLAVWWPTSFATPSERVTAGHGWPSPPPTARSCRSWKWTSRRSCTGAR